MKASAKATTIAVSSMNMPKMPPPLAPLHLCTPTILARRLSEEMEIRA